MSNDETFLVKSNGCIEIEAPIGDVFRLTNDHVAEWSIVVVEEETLNKTPGGVGSTFRCVTEDHGRRMDFEGVVTRYEPPRRSAVRMTGEAFDIAAEYEFEDLGTQTRVTQSSIVHGKGFFRVFLMLFGWAMQKSNCKATQAELASLKQFCENAQRSKDA